MKILLIDGSNLAWRSYWAYPDLMAADGTPTSVVYGCLQLTRTVLNEYPADKVFIFWDTGRSKFRMELYPDYKAGRDQKLTQQDYIDFNTQVKIVKEPLKLLGVRSIETMVERTEADDLMAYFTLELFKDDEVMIYSNDKDFYQLVDERVSVLHPSKKGDILYTHKNINEVTGCASWQDYVMCRSLSGDSGDHIKGVGGVGPKTAMKIIASIDGDWEKLYAQADEPIFKEIVERNRQMFDLRMGSTRLSGVVKDELQVLGMLETEFKPDEVKKLLYGLSMGKIVGGFIQWVVPFRTLATGSVM